MRKLSWGVMSVRSLRPGLPLPLHYDVVKLLVRRGGGNTPDKSNLTPLQAAVHYRYIRVVKLLLESDTWPQLQTGKDARKSSSVDLEVPAFGASGKRQSLLLEALDTSALHIHMSKQHL